MRHRGDGGGTDKSNGDRATIISGLPMDGATHHLGAQLLMWVRQDGMRLENPWAELFTKRRRDSLHHQTPHVGHDGSKDRSIGEGGTAVSLISQDTE